MDGARVWKGHVFITVGGGARVWMGRVFFTVRGGAAAVRRRNTAGLNRVLSIGAGDILRDWRDRRNWSDWCDRNILLYTVRLDAAGCRSRTRVHAHLVPRLCAVLRRFVTMKTGEMPIDLVNLHLLLGQERTEAEASN